MRSSATSSAITGMNCAALAPLPITATRLPRRSTSWSQRAEWNDGPRKRSRPAMSGSLGRFSWPTALITAWATTVPVPSAVRTSSVQLLDASSKRADITSVPKRTWRRRSSSSAHVAK